MSIPAGSASKIALSSRVVNHVLHVQAIAVDVWRPTVAPSSDMPNTHVNMDCKREAAAAASKLFWSVRP